MKLIPQTSSAPDYLSLIIFLASLVVFLWEVCIKGSKWRRYLSVVNKRLGTFALKLSLCFPEHEALIKHKFTFLSNWLRISLRLFHKMIIEWVYVEWASKLRIVVKPTRANKSDQAVKKQTENLGSTHIRMQSPSLLCLNKWHSF